MQTVDLIDSLVQMLTVEVTFLSITEVDGCYIAATKCSWWVTPGCKYTIDDEVYKVTELVQNESITFKPFDHEVPLEATSMALEAPTYLHGTLKDSQNEVDADLDKTKIYPMVYLQEIIRDRKTRDEESMIDRESDLRIYFLNEAFADDWLTDDHYTNVIGPMSSMVDLFISKVNSSRFFTENYDYDETNLIKVSVEGKQENSIFDTNLSGIELRLFSEIRKDLTCVNKKCLN